jgi:hypothetical protein
MNKPKITLLFVAAAFACAFSALDAAMAAAPASSTLTQPRASPHDTVSLHVGDPSKGPLVTIIYGRPYAKGRKIFGDGGDYLVPDGKVWRMGADEATTLITPKDMVIGDVTIPAGAYTLDMVPMKDGPSKFIVNKSIGRWGIPYDEKAQAPNEFPRMDMKTETLDKPVEEFTITIENNPAGGGIIKLQWETTQYTVAFTLKP